MTKQLVVATILLSILSTLGLLWYLSFPSTLTPERVVTTPEETFAEPKVTETEMAEYEDIVDDVEAQEGESSPGSPEADSDTVVESEEETEEPPKLEYTIETIFYERLPGLEVAVVDKQVELIGTHHTSPRESREKAINLDKISTTPYTSEDNSWSGSLVYVPGYSNEATSYQDYYWWDSLTHHLGFLYLVGIDAVYRFDYTGAQKIIELTPYHSYFDNDDLFPGNIIFINDTGFYLLLYSIKDDTYNTSLIIKGDIETGRTDLIKILENDQGSWYGNYTYSLYNLALNDNYIHIFSRPGCPCCGGITARIRTTDNVYEEITSASLFPYKRFIDMDDDFSYSVIESMRLSRDRSWGAVTVGIPESTAFIGEKCGNSVFGHLKVWDSQGNVRSVEQISDRHIDIIGWTYDSKYLLYKVGSHPGFTYDQISAIGSPYYVIYSPDTETKWYRYSKAELTTLLNELTGDDRFSSMMLKVPIYSKGYYMGHDLSYILSGVGIQFH